MTDTWAEPGLEEMSDKVSEGTVSGGSHLRDMDMDSDSAVAPMGWDSGSHSDGDSDRGLPSEHVQSNTG